MKGLMFIGWMLKRMFGGVYRVYQSYDKMITTDPLLAFLPTLFIGLMTFMVSVIVAFIANISVDVWQWCLLTIEVIVVGNYIRILLREQYKKFIKEREQIFDILKDTK